MRINHIIYSTTVTCTPTSESTSSSTPTGTLTVSLFNPTHLHHQRIYIFNIRNKFNGHAICPEGKSADDARGPPAGI